MVEGASPGSKFSTWFEKGRKSAPMCPELLGNIVVGRSTKNGDEFDSSDGRSDLVGPRTNFLAILGHFSRPRDWARDRRTTDGMAME